jgi:hypothetical protein
MIPLRKSAQSVDNCFFQVQSNNSIRIGIRFLLAGGVSENTADGMLLPALLWAIIEHE